MRPKEENADFAMRLKEAMSLAKISQAELSRRSGVSKTLITKYLSGYIAPKQKNKYAIARACGVSPIWLDGFGDKDDVNPVREEIIHRVKNMDKDQLDKLDVFIRTFLP